MADPSPKSPPRTEPRQSRGPKPQRPKPSPNTQENGKSNKLRGRAKDPPEVRLSKTLSWLLRHGAAGEGLEMRRDGYVRVDDLMKNSRLQPLGLTVEKLQEVVKADSKQRFTLIWEREEARVVAVPSSVAAGAAVTAEGKGVVWLVKANQGHSMKTVELDLKPITSVTDIPSGIAVHGTTRDAWRVIEKEGLSRMARNHIHLAQGVGGNHVISGIRGSSQILIFINVQKALDAGIKFELSDNGVVLTTGGESGYLKPEFFERVEDVESGPLRGWEGKAEAAAASSVSG